MRDYWFSRLIAPALRLGTSAGAIKAADAIEGVPASLASSSARPARPGGRSRSPLPRRGNQRASRMQSGQAGRQGYDFKTAPPKQDNPKDNKGKGKGGVSIKDEICDLWNKGDKRCSRKDGSCRHGRLHIAKPS